MYEILKDFAGPLATFAGAIIGLLVVAWQTQRGFRNLIASQQHQAQIEREIAAEQLEREKLALSAALTGELFSLWHQVKNANAMPIAQSILLEEMIKDGAQGKRDAILPIFPIRVPIYEANITKLGLLGSSLAGDVARVFSRATIAPSTSTGQQAPQMDIKMLKGMIDGLVQANKDWLEDISHVISRLSALECGTNDLGPLYTIEATRAREKPLQ